MILTEKEKIDWINQNITNDFIKKILNGDVPKILKYYCRKSSQQKLNRIAPYIDKHKVYIIPFFEDEFSIFCVKILGDKNIYCSYILEEDKFEDYGQSIQSIFKYILFCLFEIGEYEDAELIDLGEKLGIKNAAQFISQIKTSDLNEEDFEKWLVDQYR